MTARDNLATYRARVEVENAARLENLHWFAETGESFVGAAERLDLSADSLERWCHRRGLYALLATLRARDPFDPDFTASERGRLGAQARWPA